MFTTKTQSIKSELMVKARGKAKVALVGHANAARDEMKHLADEFISLARQTSVPTPAIDRLYSYFDTKTPLMPDGSATIPLQWW